MLASGVSTCDVWRKERTQNNQRETTNESIRFIIPTMMASGTSPSDAASHPDGDIAPPPDANTATPADVTCRFCSKSGASECALEIWAESLNSIFEDVGDEIEQDNGPPLPNHTIRKEIYRRLARARGWFGKRYQFEGCIAGDIRDAYPRRDNEPPYMGHLWH